MKIGLASFLLLFGSMVYPAAAQDVDIAARYDIYWKGVRVFSSDVALAINADQYTVESNFRPRGLVKMFVSGHSDIKASGQIAADGRVTAQDYEVEGRWDGDRSYRKIEFDENHRVVAMTVETPEEWKENGPILPIPEDLQYGPDPMSVLVAILRHPWNRESQAEPYSIRSIDGESVYEYMLVCGEGPVSLRQRKSRSPFYGAVTYCTAVLEQVAGFLDVENLNEKQRARFEKRKAKAEKRAKNKKSDRPDNMIELWFQSFDDVQMMVPIKARIRSPRGRISVYLAKFEDAEQPSLAEGVGDATE